jgi:hypothetical protein
LAGWAASAGSPDSRLYFDSAGLAQSRTALPALRELVGSGGLVHDGGAALSAQVCNALVVPGAAGLSLSPRCPRSDLLRAVAWAAQRLTDSGAAAAPFRVM